MTPECGFESKPSRDVRCTNSNCTRCSLVRFMASLPLLPSLYLASAALLCPGCADGVSYPVDGVVLYLFIHPSMSHLSKGGQNDDCSFHSVLLAPFLVSTKS